MPNKHVYLAQTQNSVKKKIFDDLDKLICHSINTYAPFQSLSKHKFNLKT